MNRFRFWPYEAQAKVAPKNKGEQRTETLLLPLQRVRAAVLNSWHSCAPSFAGTVSCPP